jgi:hypothetical protein
MNDNDVPDMPDRLEIKITADDYAKLRQLSKTSDITHCIRCLATSPGGGDPGWGAGGFRNGSHNMARRAHCARGHAYSPENTRIRKSGGRRCVRCVREDCRRRYARRWPPFKEAG